jgi:hypothetical protein
LQIGLSIYTRWRADSDESEFGATQALGVGCGEVKAACRYIAADDIAQAGLVDGYAARAERPIFP